MALDTYASLYNKVKLRAPGVSSLLARDWVSHAFRRCLDAREFRLGRTLLRGRRIAGLCCLNRVTPSPATGRGPGLMVRRAPYATLELWISELENAYLPYWMSC